MIYNYLDDLKKVRRRVEDYLRKCTPQELVKVATCLKIKIPRKLLKVLRGDNSKANSQ